CHIVGAASVAPGWPVRWQRSPRSAPGPGSRSPLAQAITSHPPAAERYLVCRTLPFTCGGPSDREERGNGVRWNGLLGFISRHPHAIVTRPLFKFVAVALNRVKQRGVTQHGGSEPEGTDSPVHVIPEVLAVVVLARCPQHPRYVEPWRT